MYKHLNNKSPYKYKVFKKKKSKRDLQTSPRQFLTPPQRRWNSALCVFSTDHRYHFNRNTAITTVIIAFRKKRCGRQQIFFLLKSFNFSSVPDFPNLLEMHKNITDFETFEIYETYSYHKQTNKRIHKKKILQDVSKNILELLFYSFVLFWYTCVLFSDNTDAISKLLTICSLFRDNLPDERGSYAGYSIIGKECLYPFLQNNFSQKLV